ncbi:MAG TPA: PASTA domain-containing protein [Actinomycetota bacterium]|nr:PASTA domain-containing protein [Actinomycetota bacterium]
MALSPTQQPVTGALIGGRYLVETRLEPQGEISRFRVVDQTSGRTFLLRLLPQRLSGDQAFVERLQRSAAGAACLTHPGIVAVRDWGRSGPRLFVASEIVPGTPLGEFIARAGAMDPHAAQRVLSAVTAALDHAHAHGVTHGSVNSDYVWMLPGGEIKVVDFGAAGLLEKPWPSAPPEPAGDIGGLGALAFEMLTGRRQPPPVAAVPAIGARNAESQTAPAIAQPNETSPLRLVADSPAVPEAFGADTAVLQPALIDFEPESETAEADLNATMSIPSGWLDYDAPSNPADTAETKVVPIATDGGADGGFRTRSSARMLIFPAIVMALFAAGLAYAKAPRGAEVPDVTAARQAAAVRTLREAGFTVRTSTEFHTDVATGSVLRTDPAAGRSLDRGAPVTVYVSGGPPPLELPSVTGRGLSSAKKALETAGFVVGEVSREMSEEVATGVVISQNPEAGQAQAGATVDLVVSSGPEAVTLPSMSGMTLDAARRALTEAGFKTGSVTHAADPKAQAGTVVSQRPAPGKAKSGTKVDLVVSKGADTVALPRVAGKTRAAAVAALTAAGLIPVVTLENSGSVAEGVVIRTAPSSTTAPRGSKVTVVVSRGPKVISVPNFVGMTRTQARSRAQSLGLKVSGEEAVPGSGRPSGQIQGQSPAAGTSLRSGAGIRLFYAA